LIDENQYECGVCKRKCDAKKRFSIEKSPSILVIHLKRFGNDGKKINAKVRFPAKFSLKQFTSESVDRVAGLPAICFAKMHRAAST
jgi:ubiquitin C-terminal hydrolase